MTRAQGNLALADPVAEAIEAVHGATAIYTAGPVVRDVLARLKWPTGARRLCDPACGDGAFLDGALRALLDAQPDAGDAQIASQLEGWEFYPAAADAARLRLRETLQARGRGLAQAMVLAERIVRTADFLIEGPRVPAYDVIAGNPPYLRFLKVPSVLQAEYRQRAPRYALHDLVYTFLDRCSQVLRPGGACGLVTADRWLFGEGASELRRELGQRLALRDVYRLDSASAFYRPKYRRAGTPPRVHPVVVVLDKTCDPGAYVLDGSPIFPGAGTEPVAGARLADVARIQLAPWLGTRGIFTVDAQVAAALPAGSCVPAADSTDFVDGELSVTRYALVTRADCSPSQEVLAHLEREIPRMCARGRRVPMWMPPETWDGRFDLATPCLLIPRISRGLRVLRLPQGVLPINHGVTVAQAGSLSLDELAALLERPESQAWVQARAARLEDGYLSITTRLLRELPVAP